MEKCLKSEHLSLIADTSITIFPFQLRQIGAYEQEVFFNQLYRL